MTSRIRYLGVAAYELVAPGRRILMDPVSYTHLTLPTICSV